MSNKVRYNGGTEASDKARVFIAVSTKKPTISESYKCTKIIPGNVEFDSEVVQTSPVKEIRDLGSNIFEITTLNSTYIVLVWSANKAFDEPPVYIALCKEKPVSGSCYRCERVIFTEKGFDLKPVCTSIVKDVRCLGNNLYEVTTFLNSTYIVLVGES